MLLAALVTFNLNVNVRAVFEAGLYILKIVLAEAYFISARTGGLLLKIMLMKTRMVFNLDIIFILIFYLCII